MKKTRRDRRGWGAEHAQIFLRGCAGMSDQRERQSRAVRHVRPTAGAGGRGLGALPNKHIGIAKRIFR